MIPSESAFERKHYEDVKVNITDADQECFGWTVKQRFEGRR